MSGSEKPEGTNSDSAFVSVNDCFVNNVLGLSHVFWVLPLNLIPDRPEI